MSISPLYYERYIEVFGGGWILFRKPPGNDFEAYSDFNGLLVNLYRCVREKTSEPINALRYCFNARENSDYVKNALARDSPASDVQKAACFYQLICYSYASGLTSYGSRPHDIHSNFPLIEQAHRRLAKVVENKDFEKLIVQYDRPVSFFYCDLPYFGTESYYKNVGEDGFTEKDHIRLRDALMKAEGKFLLSYNDCDFIRNLYDAPGIQIDAYTRINNIKQRYDNGAQFPEILIANYDMQERSRNAPAQMPQWAAFLFFGGKTLDDINVHHHALACAIIHLFDYGVVLNFLNHAVVIIGMRGFVFRINEGLPPCGALDGKVNQRNNAVDIKLLCRL